MITTLLAQDPARIAGLVAGRALFLVGGVVLIALGIWRRSHPRPGSTGRRGSGWMIGIGLLLVVGTLAGATAIGARAA